MSDSAVSISSQLGVKSAQQAGPVSPERQVQKDINDVAKALKADDAPAAKTAVSKLQESLQNVSPSQNNQQTGGTQIADAVKALGETLKTGNVADAKQAFAVVQQVQQEKIDQKNSASTREAASKPVGPPPPPVPASGGNPSIGSTINTTA